MALLPCEYRLPPERDAQKTSIEGILLPRTPKPTKFSRTNPTALSLNRCRSVLNEALTPQCHSIAPDVIRWRAIPLRKARLQTIRHCYRD
ncbi:hypothetical protein AVEN_188382-1 [Araneus ventricosus]|uniref:Uncharacterized protein n=1 Tax=Araneus ventricosus TaxID=182803 RepID=A0A4Y2E9C4_ARAVE|nr:hypothetical protein AVEN_188382-1 [Araneus ventricosus]